MSNKTKYSDFLLFFHFDLQKKIIQIIWINCWSVLTLSDHLTADGACSIRLCFNDVTMFPVQ